MKLVSMLYDDVTGVLMQCISRIPLSCRRKAKTPAFAGVLKFFFNGEHTMPIVRTN
jgi:hypothetical protein